jgi:hypothetical protein
MHIELVWVSPGTLGKSIAGRLVQRFIKMYTLRLRYTSLCFRGDGTHLPLQRQSLWSLPLW